MLTARDDQYLLGSDLLVAPVLAPGATTCTLRLPAGTWCTCGRDACCAARASVTVRAPIGEPPVLSVRAPCC